MRHRFVGFCFILSLLIRADSLFTVPSLLSTICIGTDPAGGSHTGWTICNASSTQIWRFAYLMLSLFGLGGSGRGRKDDERTYSPFAGSPETSRNRVVGRAFEDDSDEEDDEDGGSRPRHQNNVRTSYFDANVVDYDEEQEEEEEEDGDEDEDDVDTPLLPIFSAAHLDRLPLYNITHAIRLLIVQRCETTLSWDQLRSPQVSQFLVKPIQTQIQANHMNRATLCALITNCLQFQKEAQLNPGNVGVSRTRALISELLAMRLIKEFSTRELIDALSYDFDPLQGMSPPNTAAVQRTQGWSPYQDFHGQRAHGKGARVSTIEVAIKAQAKRFLAHPLIVQHLEAIWAGTVVFHSEADNLHRKPSAGEEPFVRGPRYGTIDEHSPSAMPADSVLSRKAERTRMGKRPSTDMQFVRRSVTIYNPRDASLFKLSRLRVPRYRQIFSTFSFATMLALFLAVLIDRSLSITPLEILFWFWSAGYMLDEVVGFTEQGFGLYLLSFWNAFDIGILVLFVVYYCLRLYGIVLADENKQYIANMAYDALASTAVLLFPRLFSVLDHYRYFSQLLIAFRMMAQDLAAVLILILISCSGFFVAFTLSFADEKTDGNGVAYALFQILMGFTPAAWDKWPGFNLLGKSIMVAFLIICHFLIVTILITVLTNSFMAIVRNAEEEHQFLFAINTISMVKSDALFSYIPPSNVVGWTLSPLRYIMPFRQYVKLNRTVIKISHFPILFVIFSYERVLLSKQTYSETDLVERQPRHQSKPLAFSVNKVPDAFSPGRRLLREPSVISFHKDRALEEVFRRPYRGSSTIRTTTGDRRNSSSAVDQWMEGAEVEGGASPPLEQPRSVVERLEKRRPSYRRSMTSEEIRAGKRSRELSSAVRSMPSDADIRSSVALRRRPQRIEEETEDLLSPNSALRQETDADADDEINDESELAGPAIGESAVSVVDKENRRPGSDSDGDEYFHTPKAGKSPMMQLSSPAVARLQNTPNFSPIGAIPQPRLRPKRIGHSRKTSTGTTLFAPIDRSADTSTSGKQAKSSKQTTAKNSHHTGTSTPVPINLPSGQRTPKLKPARARPIMPPRQNTAPNPPSGVGMAYINVSRETDRRPSFYARALDLASEIGDNKWGPSGVDAGGISGMPASFSEQLLRERDRERRREEERRRTEDEEKGMVNRILLARMHTLEEGFREVLREVKDLTRSTAGSSRRESDGDGSVGQRPRTRRKDQGEGKGRGSPKKGGKGKEVLRTSAGLRTELAATATPESVRSVGNDEMRQFGDEEKPGTAARTPEPSSGME